MAAKFWRRKASTLSKNFLKAMSTQRSAFGSSEGPPSRTLVLKESGASKNEEQKEDAGPRADLMHERSLFLSVFNWPSNVALRPGSEFADWGIGFDARMKAATQVAIGGQVSPDSSIEVKINQFWMGLVQVDQRVQATGRWATGSDAVKNRPGVVTPT
eukprot:jgi/Bigna1/83117/fgenesh1_pg.102_\